VSEPKWYEVLVDISHVVDGYEYEEDASGLFERLKAVDEKLKAHQILGKPKLL
jgi:hypothetical protein